MDLIVKNSRPWRDGEVRDLYIADGHFVEPPGDGDSGDAGKHATKPTPNQHAQGEHIPCG